MRLLPKVLMSFSALALLPSAAAAQEARPFATIFKNPQCGCCESYGDYLEASGYEVKMVATHDLALIKERQGCPPGSRDATRCSSAATSSMDMCRPTALTACWRNARGFQASRFPACLQVRRAWAVPRQARGRLRA